MILSTLLALAAFVLSAIAASEPIGSEIQSGNKACMAFISLLGGSCISTPENEDGVPLVIHNRNMEASANQNWILEFPTPASVGPQQISVFGDKIWTCTPGNTKSAVDRRRVHTAWVFRLGIRKQWRKAQTVAFMSDSARSDNRVMRLTCTSHTGALAEAPRPERGIGLIRKAASWHLKGASGWKGSNVKVVVVKHYNSMRRKRGGAFAEAGARRGRGEGAQKGENGGMKREDITGRGCGSNVEVDQDQGESNKFTIPEGIDDTLIAAQSVTSESAHNRRGAGRAAKSQKEIAWYQLNMTMKQNGGKEKRRESETCAKAR
ncbi:hypothetical protein C8R44DRAFT_735296 [Mycena epipterygia]|nr:hypothetical protein C8R44DRAFT_735296 [Mycena epipterygia]